MHAEVEKVFSNLSTDKVIERLEAAEIANAKLNDMDGFWNHPQLQARGRWAQVASPAGPVRSMKPPFNLDRFEPRMDAIPAVGEHTRAVLAELGYTEEEIERLAAP